MAAPLLCADNIGNVNLYPQVLTTDQSGTTGPTGYEVWRAFRSSRNVFAYWQPGVTNTEAWLQFQHPDQPRAVNFWALSYGHNLAGVAVKIQGSNDASTWATILSVTIPTTTGGLLNSGMGVLTEMGDWLITHQTLAYHYWRFDIPAMGAGKQPLIPCLQPGFSYQPVALYRPLGEHRTKLSSQMIMTPLGWMGRGTRAFNRVNTLSVRADANDYEYLAARFQIEELFGSGRPMWVIHDQDRASEAYCVVRPDGEAGFARPQQLYWPTAEIQVIEHEPLQLN